MADQKVFKYSAAFQEAVVGYALKDPAFALQCYHRLDSKWFTCDVIAVAIYIQLGAFYKQHGLFPTSIEEFFNQTFFLSQPILERDKIKTTSLRCLEMTKQFTLEYIRKSLTGFLRESLLKEGLNTAVTQFNKKGSEDAYEYTKKRLEEIRDATFLEEFKTISFDGGLDWLRKNKDTKSNSISTGSHDLDRALGGGLFKGETCAVMAPVNVGKSRSLMTMMRHALVQGYKVLYITHEDHPDRIIKRIYGCIIGMSPKQIDAFLDGRDVDPENMYASDGQTYIRLDPKTARENTEYVMNQVELACGDILKNLTFMPYVETGKMFVDDLVIEIKDLQQEQIMKTGRGYDMIIDDYPKKLKIRGGRELYRAELAEIYDMFNQLAAELGVHCLVALQTNRAAARNNKEGELDSSFSGTEDADESFGIVQNLGAVISLNRSEDDDKKEIAHFSIAKSRNDKKGVSVTTRTRFYAGLTHGDANMFEKYGTRLPYGLESVYHDSNRRGTTDAFNAELQTQKDSIIAGIEFAKKMK